MAPRDDDDRRIIHARRAALLGSALAALSCGPRAEAAAPTPSPSGVEVPAPGGGGAVDPGAPPPPRQAPAAAETPPFLVPAGVTGEVRARYEQLNQKLQQLHGLLDDAEAALPNCPVTDTSCQASWRSVLEKLHEMTSERTFMHACPGVSEAARKFGDYASEHMKALSERERQLNDRIAALAMGQAAEKRLAELREAVRAAKPIPCLSFACSDW